MTNRNQKKRVEIRAYPIDTEQRRHATYGIGGQNETPVIIEDGAVCDTARRTTRDRSSNESASSEELTQ